jgi:hypothetical protein
MSAIIVVADMKNFESISDKFNAIGISTSRSHAQKRITYNTDINLLFMLD